jgi:hypothetical protein
MNPWRWVDPRIGQVRLANVRAYFLGRGWKLKPNPNPDLLRFEEPAKGKGRPFFQMVPSSDDFDAFRQRIMELITTLSEIENRHPVAVLEDMLRSDAGTAGANGAEGRQPARRRSP